MKMLPTMQEYEDELKNNLKDLNLTPLFEEAHTNIEAVEAIRDEIIALMKQGDQEQVIAKLQEADDKTNTVSTKVEELFHTMRARKMQQNICKGKPRWKSLASV